MLMFKSDAIATHVTRQPAKFSGYATKQFGNVKNNNGSLYYIIVLIRSWSICYNAHAKRLGVYYTCHACVDGSDVIKQLRPVL